MQRIQNVLQHRVTLARRQWLYRLIELLLVVTPALFISQEWLRWDETMVLPGHETSWLVGSAQVAHDAFRETGRLVRWNPYYSLGEPLIENAFTFILNPFSSLPSLAVGAVQGIKWSAAFYMVFTALGGWYCGRALGLNVVGRVLLAWLLLFKGNQHMMLRYGYFQLAVQQAYFGWIVGAAVELLTTRKRYPLVLTALMIVLLFFAGNVWYILPVLIGMGALTLVFGIRKKGLNWITLRRMTLAAVLTLLLGAAAILPVALQRSAIGRHDPEMRAGWEIQDRLQAFTLYFDGAYETITRDMTIYDVRYNSFSNGWLLVHYSYVAPLAFAALLAVGGGALIIYRARLRRRPKNSGAAPVMSATLVRIILVALVMIVLMTMWGMGGTDLFVWLYKHVPGLNGWRFVGRALAMGAFWVAVLLAIGTHIIWRGFPQRILRAGLLLSIGLVLLNHISYWPYTSTILHREPNYEKCLADFRQTYFPDEPLTMEMPGYQFMTAFVNNRIRHLYIEADFRMLPQPNTVGQPADALLDVIPPYYVLQDEPLADALREAGTYLPLLDTSGASYLQSCIWYSVRETLPYAFTLGRSWQTDYADLPPQEWLSAPIVTPITTFYREYDTIAVVTPPTFHQQYLVITENASKGWNVRLDGVAVPLEVIGGVIAVKLPQDGQAHEIVFEFRSTLYTVGAALTILGAVISIVYLLWPLIRRVGAAIRRSKSE